MIDIKRSRYVNQIAEEWLDMVKKFFNDSCRPYIELSLRKRRYFNSYAQKLKYECLRVVFDYAKDRRLKKAYMAKLDYWWKHIDGIILANPNVMDTQIKKWKKKKIGDIMLLKVLSKSGKTKSDTYQKRKAIFGAKTKSDENNKGDTRNSIAFIITLMMGYTFKSNFTFSSPANNCCVFPILFS